MKDFSSVYLTEPNKNIEADTNEMVGLILSTMLLSFAFKGAFVSGGDKGGSSKGGDGANFWSFMTTMMNNRREDKKEKEAKKADDQVDDKKKNQMFNELLMMSRKSNEKEKDENAKKKNGAMIKLLTACSFDKDGNEIPLDQRIDKMKDTMTPEQFEAFKKDMTDTYEKNKDNQEFKDALVKERAKITPESYEEYIKNAKTEAKSTLEQLDKEKEAIEKWEKELADMEAAVKGEDDKDKKKKLEEELKAKQQQAPQSLVGAATGVTGGGTPAKPAEPAEPKEKTKEEKDAEIKAIEDEYKQKSKALEDEYNQKIKDESDPDKKKELEDEWAKKEKALTAEKNKKQDDIDDTDEHKDDDETKQGKYTVKDEEITDPKTGEKKTVKTYTGPRGGKFYYPDGAPKKPENKVYVEHLTLSDYLFESLV